MSLSIYKYFILLFFLAQSFSIFSQHNVSGVVQNKRKEVLSYANITVYYLDKSLIAGYTTSDENGRYSLQLKDSTYLFKVSYLGYKPLLLKKAIVKDEVINFTLSEDNKELKEITVKSKAVDIIVRNDTIKYNLKAISTGNEENLQDILKKLPGIEITENGKIKANGKQIDKLLIDGKEFFGEQHQLASENISSEMIKGISLLNNFKDFADLDNNSKFGKTAMNIEIKDEYKGKIKGKLEAGSGYKNKYETSANLYTFKNKTNLFFIANANNLGNQTFSITDYISFQGGVDKFLKDGANSVSISGDDLPPFLLSKNEFKDKNEQLGALNFSYKPSAKFNLNTHIIFDRTNTLKEQYIKQNYLNNAQNLTIDLNNTAENTFLVNSSYINAKYKPESNLIFEYTLNFSPQKSDANMTDMLSTRNFNTEVDKNSYSLNQAFNYKHKIHKYNLSATLYHSIKNKDENLHIVSNQPFLGLNFKDNDYSSLQNVNNYYSNYGFQTSISRKVIKHLSTKISYGISKQTSRFNSHLKVDNVKNNIDLNFINHTAGIKFYNNQRSFISYQAGINYNILKISDLYKYTLLPFASIRLNINKSHSLSASYKKTIETVKASHIISNTYIRNYNTLAANRNISKNIITDYDNFNLNYFIYDMFSSTMLNIGANYVLGRNIIAKNTVTTNDYHTNYHTIADNSSNLSVYFMLDKKLGKYPFSIRLNSMFSQIKEDNFLENKANTFNSEQVSNNIRILSVFRRSIFNFELGYSLKQNKISLSNISNNSQFTLNKVYSNFFIDYKQFSIELRTAFEYFKSDKLSEKYYRIAPIVRYKFKKLSFYIKGKDLLQMNKNLIIQNSFYGNYFEEKNISVLGGRIIVGLKYTF